MQQLGPCQRQLMEFKGKEWQNQDYVTVYSLAPYWVIGSAEVSTNTF